MLYDNCKATIIASALFLLKTNYKLNMSLKCDNYDYHYTGRLSLHWTIITTLNDYITPTINGSSKNCTISTIVKEI